MPTWLQISFQRRVPPINVVRAGYSTGFPGTNSRLSAKSRIRGANRKSSRYIKSCLLQLKGFPEAFAALFPRTQAQLCLVHLTRASLQYVSYKECRAVADNLRTICQAPTAAQGIANLEAVEAKWQERYLHLLRSWRTLWERMAPMYEYPEVIRKLIYTTNAVESLNISLQSHAALEPTPPHPQGVFLLQEPQNAPHLPASLLPPLQPRSSRQIPQISP